MAGGVIISDDMSLRSFYPLHGGVRHYAWGQRASQENTPLIADLLQEAPGEEPWAELWLGAHASLPSQVEMPDGTSRPLDQVVAEAPAEWLGAKAAAVKSQLAFLFKVLTCSAPLSIQSHPDAQSAVQLHATRPELYPDPNDKTEIIIALEPFQALAGFRGLTDILHDLEAVQAFEPWLALWKHGELTLKGLVETLFALSTVPLVAMLNSAVQELNARKGALSPADKLFLSLSQVYPGDRGTLFAYLLNQVALAPGQALFLAPNSPHAYQKGAGIECMTNSDNVIRAGLTPKAVDVDTLLKTVQFDRTGYLMVTPKCTASEGGKVLEYQAPTEKFRLTFYHDATCDLADHPDVLGLFLVVQGEATLVDADGKRTPAPRGTSWIRPAAAAKGRIEASKPGTVVVWAQTNF